MKFSEEGFMRERKFLVKKGGFRCSKGYFEQGSGGSVMRGNEENG